MTTIRNVPKLDFTSDDPGTLPGERIGHGTLPALDEESWTNIHNSTPEHLRDGAPDYQSYVTQYNQNPMPRGVCGTSALQMGQEFRNKLRTVGTKPLTDAMNIDSDRSALERLMGGSLLGSDGNPEGPGFAYFNHLFRRNGGQGAIKKAKKDAVMKGTNIYTEAQEAIKVAIKALGVASSFNPSGLPIDIRDAQKLWFGEDEEDETKISQWRTTTEMGDAAIDPKKVRKFTNYDGSMTWEILNDDKTVSSRFTLGEFAGTKIFAQGGYNKFTEMLEKVKQQVGYDENTGFDAVRSKYGV